MEYLSMFSNHETVRQELYPCNVPLCTKTLTSRKELEKHILMKHSGNKAAILSSVVDFEFDFGTASETNHIKSKPIQPILNKSEPIQSIIKTTEPTPSIVRKSEPIQLTIKRENNLEVVKVKYKKWIPKTASGAEKVAKIRKQECLVRNESDFSIHKIEMLTKIKLSEEAEADFETLIKEGKDQEIYCKLFGNIFGPSDGYCRNWICKMCPSGKYLGSKKDFQAHFKANEHGSVAYTCELCSRSHNTFVLLKAHLKKRHFTDAKCEMCQVIFRSDERLQMHKLKIHEVGGFQCDSCTKMVSSMFLLKAHITQSHGDQTFTCSTCMKEFKTKGSCAAHEATHSGKVYECEYCIDRFISEIGKTRHVKLQHTMDFEKFTCDECGKTFKEKTRFNNHIKFHQKHEDLICNICDKLFHAMKSKVLHKATVHDKIRKFACAKCEFKTVSQGKLKRHTLKTHEHQQEVCFLCNITVKHAYQHVRSAHKDKPTAWQEFMERKRVALKLLKSRSINSETKLSQDSPACADTTVYNHETRELFSDDQELPSDSDIGSS